MRCTTEREHNAGSWYTFLLEDNRRQKEHVYPPPPRERETRCFVADRVESPGGLDLVRDCRPIVRFDL